MKKMHVYEVVFMLDGQPKKQYLLGTSKRDLTSRMADKQEIIRCKEVTDDFVISLSQLRAVLTEAGYGEVEVALIMSAMESISTKA